jgi:hypothetical protein
VYIGAAACTKELMPNSKMDAAGLRKTKLNIATSCVPKGRSDF